MKGIQRVVGASAILVFWDWGGNLVLNICVHFMDKVSGCRNIFSYGSMSVYVVMNEASWMLNYLEIKVTIKYCGFNRLRLKNQELIIIL